MAEGLTALHFPYITFPSWGRGTAAKAAVDEVYFVTGAEKLLVSTRRCHASE